MDALTPMIDWLTDNFDFTNSIALAAVTAIFLLANRVVRLRFGIPLLVTVVCGGSALFLILTRDFLAPIDAWAYAVVGALLGYWMTKKS